MNIAIKRICLLVVSAFLFGSAVFAQYEDFRVWSSVDVSKSFGDVTGRLELGQRFKENVSANERTLATFGLRYKLGASSSIEAGYRYQLVNNMERQVEAKYRVHTDFRWKHSFGDFSLKIRERLQYGFEDFGKISYANENNFYNRLRLGAAYDIFGLPVEAAVSCEMYHQITSYVMPATLRLKAGFDYSLSNSNTVNLSYMYDREINRVNPLYAYVINLSYSIDL